MENIQIFELKLKDYRQYEDETSISLETTTDDNINVIVGQNGAGKSNILNAITFCFYGEEAHIDSQSNEGLDIDPYVTKRKLQELSPGDSLEGFVEVKLGKEEPRYAFRRTFTTVRKGSNNESEEPQFNNSVGDLRLRQRFGGNDWRPISQPNNVLREILPTHVHQYFLFDGEQLDEFFQPGYSTTVKDAVLDVSHVELLNSAVEHLNTVRREFESESADMGGDVSHFQKRKQNAEEELENLEEDKRDLEKEIEKAEAEVEEIDNQLAASADEDIREKQKRRQFIKGKLDEKETQLEEAKIEVATSLARTGAVAYNLDALQHAISALEDYEASKEGIPGLTEELLEAISSRGRCICGTEFSDDQQALEHIQQLLDEWREDSAEHIGGRIRMERAIDKCQSLMEELIEDKQEVEEVRDWIDEKETELSELFTQLDDVDTIDAEEAVELEEQRQRILNRIDRMNQELGELRGEIKQQQEIVEERDDEWRKALEKREENQILVQKSVFIEDATDKLRNINRDILKQVRSEIEDRLEQYYNDLIWKSEDYTINLTENYEVELFNQDGRKNLGSLAAGERQVLALSFMASLSKISGFSAPIIIDTPLGRISSDPKKLIAQNVPNYLRESQVTFLMTDVEYSQDVRAFVEDEVANEYLLDYQDGVTEVVEYE